MEQEQLIQEVLPLRESLVAYARRMQGEKEDAEDVAQEVLLKLWYMRHELLRYESVRALAMQMTKHLCINRLKAVERRDVEPVEWMTGGRGVTPHILLEERDTAGHLSRIIDRLPKLQQTILKMRHIDGLETGEIAQITGCAPEAVRANLSRARKKVKELFLRLDI
ncbi:MAG: sigma-70 family RNA polymerase sigma factor [Tannerellaceae bacterium]|jgi:RNA polymerase sigma-70 factor (ECF subfamily)|nr:sigma-70 family RNA polymerase sigma factor [Tannerellaceae bacterium]